MNFYNEFDPNAAQWLRNLIAAGHIPNGVVDDRSITEVKAADVLGYRQCHWFAGVAGWAEAIRLAGYESASGIFSASMPCQPFSSGGQQRGEKDERHMWPEFYRIVSECRPAAIVGEQVGSKLGREWLDGICLDLEELGYAVGASDLCAAGIGGPHIRQRIYWGAVRMADTSGSKCDGRDQSIGEHGRAFHTSDSRESCGLADAEHARRSGRIASESRGCNATKGTGTPIESGRCGMPSGLGHTESDNERRTEQREPWQPEGIQIGRSGAGLGDAVSAGLEGHARHGDNRDESGRIGTGENGSIAASGPWGDWYTVLCRDGKVRRIGSTTAPVAYGAPRSVGSLQSELEGMGVDAKRAKAMRKWAGSRLAKAGKNRVGRLRGYGNAIVPHVAATFMKAFFAACEKELGRPLFQNERSCD